MRITGIPYKGLAAKRIAVAANAITTVKAGRLALHILLCSHWFYPSVGGVETVSRILARQFVATGEQVTVVTQSDGPALEEGYTLVRRPSGAMLRLLAGQCDVVLQNMISLRTMAPLLLAGRPIVVTHQSWMRRTDGGRGLENYLKLLAVRVCRNISISKAIADSLPVASTVIGNPFEASAFSGLRDRPRDRDIVFVGRLVSDKGCDLLLRALAELKQRGLRPTLTVIGDGPEGPSLRDLAIHLGLPEQVDFRGALGAERGEVMARHRILAIPSIWAEPFGIVAVEGIAAGCAIVASEQGGLPDAVGPCGLFFPNGDVGALAARLSDLLGDQSLRQRLIVRGEQHLTRFQPQTVAQRYLDVFRGAAQK